MDNSNRVWTSELISYHDIKSQLEEENIEIDPELFLMLIQKGSLAPYSWEGIPYSRPGRRPKKYIDGLKEERRRLHHKKIRVQTSPQGGFAMDFEALLDPDALDTEHKIDERLIRIEAEIKKYESSKQDPYDWVNYRPSDNYARDAIITLIQGSYYKQSAIEKIKDSLPKLRKELPTHSQIDRSNRNNLNAAQRDRLSVREAAQEIWAKGPITIPKLAKHEEIIRACEGRIYRVETIRNWVKDINPYNKPGRPPKVKNKGI